MSYELDQLDLFGVPAPATPKPPISGLHWYAPDGTPVVKIVDWRGEPRVIPVRYIFEGVAWSGRGRIPPVIDHFIHKHKGNRERAFAAIEAKMIKRGYQRAEVAA